MTNNSAIKLAKEINSLLESHSLIGEHFELQVNSTWPEFAQFEKPIKINVHSIRVEYMNPYDSGVYMWTKESFKLDGYNDDLSYELRTIKKSIKKHLKQISC